ncbi:hypothetical protein EOK75_05730 [Pseudorhodobacter turbinis]|uniref:Flagellar protein FlgN n=1 Tax=Pseudorhodobacter turbinis TaxID=2500533 RepID=A0A4P8EER8_9RHOB|nr:hypothetical protein [Pseudorhodobacter turbinis]QCO55318.1 hypothetical protein EOK75_05730 [Pseudorhodobacter turbinis]
MTHTQSAIERLETTAKDTAAAIRAGDFVAMAELAQRAESALDDLDPQTDAARLTALRDLAGRNALALQAAAKGIRAARRRLLEVTTVRAGVQTYDNTGKTQKIGGPAGTLKARF